MILFKEDWDSYPTAIADTKTKNRSFVKYASLLKSMGVKNYAWPLALINPSLQGVDPHSKKLTYEQRAAITIECKFNKTYFFREVYRLPSGNNPLSFSAHRGNMACLWTMFSNIDFNLIAPRQLGGKSITGDGLSTHLMQFGPDKNNLFLFTKDDALRAKNVKRLNEIRDLLPRWLAPKHKYEDNNTESVSAKLKENKLWTKVAQKSIKEAGNVGRGHTLTFVQIDEGPFIFNIQHSVPALLAATSMGRKNALANGDAFGTLFTTTAGKLDTPEGAYMFKIISDSLYWNESLLDSNNLKTLQETIVTNSPGGVLMVNGTFSHRQLGYTDKELTDVIKLVKADDPDDINRDFYNLWTSGSESSPLPTKIITIIANCEKDPDHVYISPERFKLNWYIPASFIEEQMRSAHHIVTLDSGEAVGRDSNSITVMDIRDMRVVATCDINQCDNNAFALWLANFMVRYDKTTCIFEAKSSGRTIADIMSGQFVKYGIDPFTRFYNKIADQHIERKEAYEDICKPVNSRPEEIYAVHRKQLGFMTTGATRKTLYDVVLDEAARSSGNKIFDINLSTQLKCLVTKNGRVDHPVGGHDDMVISWLLGHWFVKHSTNLKHYGIDPTEVLSLNTVNGAEMSDEQINDLRKLAIVNMEIAELKDKLMGSPNPMEAKLIERQLKWKIGDASKYGEVPQTYDSVMEDINSRKTTTRSLRDSLRKLNGIRRRAA